MPEATSSVSPTALRLHEVITSMCAHPRPSFRKKEHAASLYRLLPNSHIPKQVAELFVEVTAYTAAFTEIRFAESKAALEQLCQVRSPVVDNLLHAIAQMGDAEHTLVAIDATGPSPRTGKQTTHVSFEPQRQKARDELKKRGQPAYDAKHYYDVSERIIAIEVLAGSRDPQAVPRLVEFFHAGDAKEKRAAINALAKISDAPAAAHLQEIFAAQKDAKTRRATFRALAGCKMDESQTAALAPTMLSCLTDPDASIREVALGWLKASPGSWRRAASEIQITETRQRLLSMLQEADLNVRYHAIDTLGEIGLTEDIGSLEACAKLLKPAAIPRVKEAIKRIKQRSVSS